MLLDGGYRGRTPITISGLTTGRHTVALDLPGDVRYEDAVEIQNGVMTTWTGPDLDGRGRLHLGHLVPAGRVRLHRRGVSRGHAADGRGPDRLPPGRARPPGYADWSSTAQVTSGATVQVNAYLQPLPASSSGGIAVSSDPAGAAVYLDDQVQGVTTAYGDLELTGVAAGSHTLSLRLDRYDGYRLTVEVTPDSTVKVRPGSRPRATRA